MRESSFTDKAHWEEYWQNYTHGNLPEKVVFSSFVPRLREGKSFIEIGGFPKITRPSFTGRGFGT